MRNKKEPTRLGNIDGIVSFLQGYGITKDAITGELFYINEKTQKEEVFTNRHKNSLILKLKNKGFTSVVENVTLALDSEHIKERNLIIEYFNNLKPKNNHALHDLISTINVDQKRYETLSIKNDPQEVVMRLIERWFIATFRCTTVENFVNDVMFVLISAGQGMYKTTFLNRLAPEPLKKHLFTGNIDPNLNEYATCSQLCEKFIINIDDQMDNLKPAEFGKIKSILSINHVTMRRKYSRTQETRTRIASFCGSINNESFLRDSENRRYLSVYIESIDINAAQKIDMNEVWANVKYLSETYTDQNFVYSLEDKQLIHEINKGFTLPTIEYEALFATFKLPEKDTTEVYYLTFSEILSVLRVRTNDNNLKSYNLNVAIRRLLFSPVSKRMERFGNVPYKVYPVAIVSDERGAITSIIESVVKYANAKQSIV